ncbi:MAG: hypothetical protein D3925_16740 [Candidatus Electrothrix sp. AR5]|nr:hypothetical protein [Candidatus Electrothrix sp. AR5]
MVWLVDELSTKYRIIKKIGRKWIEEVEQRPLILMLDGLDEVSEEMRPACVQAVNAYRDEYAMSGIVVACRDKEYRELADKLKLEQALCVQHLTEQQIEEYLVNGGEELTGLRTALPEDAALQELARSPLMLSMMCLAYKGKDADVILQDVDEDAGKRQHGLFATYVQRMFQRPRSGVEYEEEKTRRWLIFLASNMQKHGQTIFQMENLQPSWLLTKSEVLLYSIVAHPLVIFGVFLVVGIPLINKGSLWDIVGGLIGIMVLFPGLPSRGRHLVIRTIKDMQLLQRRFAIILFCGVAFSGIHLILLEYVFLHYKNYYSGLTVFWPILAFAVGLFTSLRFNTANQPNKEPNEGVWHTLANGLLLGGVFGFFVGIILVLAEWLFGLLSVALLNAFGLGMLCGLPVTMWFVLPTFLHHFTLRFVLWLYGYAPWNYARFLDHATDRIFLRKVGGGYIFVHRLLLEYFAAEQSHMKLPVKPAQQQE